MSQDPISNLIVIIKNGYSRGLLGVKIPYSKEKENILKVLKKENYLKNVRQAKKAKEKIILAKLLYPEGRPAISEIKRISKPGKRVYAKPNEFKPALPFSKSKNDFGSVIVSTSSGIMTAKEARKKNIGGELILKIY